MGTVRLKLASHQQPFKSNIIDTMKSIVFYFLFISSVVYGRNIKRRDVDPDSVFDKSQEKCKTAFVDNTNAKCILYTDEDCKSDDDAETTPINIPNSYLSVGMCGIRLKEFQCDKDVLFEFGKE